MLDVTGREYYVTGLLSQDRRQREYLTRRHIAARLWSPRRCAGIRVFDDASYPNIEYRNQTVKTFSLLYVLLGGSGFGAVEWR